MTKCDDSVTEYVHSVKEWGFSVTEWVHSVRE